MQTITLEKGLATFLNSLAGKNRSASTIRAYSTDIAQFISFLHAKALVPFDVIRSRAILLDVTVV